MWNKMFKTKSCDSMVTVVKLSFSISVTHVLKYTKLLPESSSGRLDHQPMFRKGVRAPLLREGRRPDMRAAEIEPK